MTSMVFPSVECEQAYYKKMLEWDCLWLERDESTVDCSVAAVSFEQVEWDGVILQNHHVGVLVANLQRAKVDSEAQEVSSARALLWQSIRGPEDNYEQRHHEYGERLAGRLPWKVNLKSDRAEWRRYNSARNHRLWQAHQALQGVPAAVSVIGSASASVRVKPEMQLAECKQKQAVKETDQHDKRPLRCERPQNRGKGKSKAKT